DRVQHRQALALGDLTVDLAEGGGQVHHAGAVVGGDEVGGDDPERVAVGGGGHEVERALVVQPHELRRVDRGEHARVVAEHRGDARLGHHDVAAPVGAGDPDVAQVRADRG